MHIGFLSSRACIFALQVVHVSWFRPEWRSEFEAPKNWGCRCHRSRQSERLWDNFRRSLALLYCSRSSSGWDPTLLWTSWFLLEDHYRCCQDCLQYTSWNRESCQLLVPAPLSDEPLGWQIRCWDPVHCRVVQQSLQGSCQSLRCPTRSDLWGKCYRYEHRSRWFWCILLWRFLRTRD